MLSWTGRIWMDKRNFPLKTVSNKTPVDVGVGSVKKERGKTVVAFVRSTAQQLKPLNQKSHFRCVQPKLNVLYNFDCPMDCLSTRGQVGPNP